MNFMIGNNRVVTSQPQGRGQEPALQSGGTARPAQVGTQTVPRPLAEVRQSGRQALRDPAPLGSHAANTRPEGARTVLQAILAKVLAAPKALLGGVGGVFKRGATLPPRLPMAMPPNGAPFDLDTKCLPARLPGAMTVEAFKTRLQGKIDHGYQLIQDLATRQTGAAPACTVKDMTDVMWCLQAMGEIKVGQSFAQGAFSIPDPDGRILKFLDSCPEAYQRNSSHLDDIQRLPGCQHRGIDAAGSNADLDRLLPHGMQTLMYGKLPGSGETRLPEQRLFMKIEEHGCFLSKPKGGRDADGPGRPYNRHDLGAFLGHAGTTIPSVLRKLTNKGEGAGTFKERLPPELTNGYQALLKTAPEAIKGLLERGGPLTKSGGVRVMLDNIKAVLSTPGLQVTPELRGSLEAFKNKLLSGPDHPECRFGEEVIFDAKEILTTSKNAAAIAAFLEAPLPEHWTPGDRDSMNSLFAPLLANADWKAALGDTGAAFMKAFIQKQCSEMPEYSQRHLSEEQVATAADSAIDLYLELRSTPGMSDHTLASILKNATPGDSNPQDSSDSMRTLARRSAIANQLDILLDKNNPASLLSRTAVELARAYGLPAISDAVLKSISNSMSNWLSQHSSRMPAEFGCAPDTSSVLAALAPRLEANVRQALEDHCQASVMIETSPTLRPEQKSVLRDISASRRIDTTQVTQLERLGGEVRNTAEGVGSDLASGNFALAIARLRGLDRASEVAFAEMKQAGASFWESGSLTDGDMGLKLRQQCIAMALADMGAPEAKALLEQLTGRAGHELVQTIMQASDPERFRNLPSFVERLIEDIASKAGLSSVESETMLDRLFTEKISFAELPAALKVEVSSREGNFDGEFLAKMKEKLGSTLTENERALMQLPGGHMIGSQLIKDLLRGAPRLVMPDGSDMVDYDGLDDMLSEKKKLESIEVGFVRLIAVCGGNEEQARALVQVAHQGMDSGFMAGSYAKDSPLQLPDGRTVMFGTFSGEAETSISFVQSGEGKITLHFESRIPSVRNVLSVETGDVVPMDADVSHLTYSYDAEIVEDGRLSITGTPSYACCLSPKTDG